MGSHSVTCHPTEVRIPPLPPAEAGTQLSDSSGIQGWDDLCYVEAYRPRIEPATCKSQVQRPTAEPICNTRKWCYLHYNITPQPRHWLIISRHSGHMMAEHGRYKWLANSAGKFGTSGRLGQRTKNKELQPGLVAFYDLRPVNRDGLFWFRHFINLLTYLDTYPLTYSPRTHTRHSDQEEHDIDVW